MSSVPQPIHDAAAVFDTLPGIGPRAALRYAYWLAGQPKDEIRRAARSLERLADHVTCCGICGLWSEPSGCVMCSDPKRDQQLISVVATSQDVRVIEESTIFKGLYHVLGGLLDPIEGRTPTTLNIDGLLRRIAHPSSNIREVILALDPDVAGDTTCLYLTKQLQTFPNLIVTRLARGLQNGAQIEYADGATIADALKNRRLLDHPPFSP